MRWYRQVLSKAKGYPDFPEAEPALLGAEGKQEQDGKLYLMAMLPSQQCLHPPSMVTGPSFSSPFLLPPFLLSSTVLWVSREVLGGGTHPTRVSNWGTSQLGSWGWYTTEEDLKGSFPPSALSLSVCDVKEFPCSRIFLDMSQCDRKIITQLSPLLCLSWRILGQHCIICWIGIKGKEGI